MKENKPWYARCANFILKLVTNKKFLISYIIVGNIWLILSMSMCNFVKNEYSRPYEEQTNFEFFRYADFILEDIAIMVIEEGVELRLHHIPDTVAEYNVNYAKDVIEFTYCLDKEEIISQYKLITGKEPYEILEDKKLEKTIWLTEEFDIAFETSLFDNIPSKEEYYYKQMTANVADSVLRNVYLILALLFIVILVVNRMFTKKRNFHKNST